MRALHCTAQKRLVAHDEERILLVKQLEEVGSTSSPATRLGSPGSEPPTNGERLQSELDALAAQIHAEKTGLSRRAGHQGTAQGKNIPAMPTLIPGELSQWMGDRQADLQNAFADGDDVQILELTSGMAKGAELLIKLTRQSEVSADELALRGAPGEGQFAPY